MNGKEIIKEYLIKNGFDGLYADDCGCFIDDLMPCSSEYCLECEPGHTCDHINEQGEKEKGIYGAVKAPCYSCGKPATKPSKHWPGAWICDKCNDFQAAADYAYHCDCEIGE